MTPTEWLLSGDTGTSSKTIFAVMTSSRASGIGSPPADNDDFGRCYRLFDHFPVWRKRLREVADKFPEWGPYVEAWDELTALWESYCDQYGRVGAKEYANNKDIAHKLYERMKEIERAGRLADGWIETGRGSWSKGDASIIGIRAKAPK